MDGGGFFLRSLRALSGLAVRREQGASGSTRGERIRARGPMPYPRHGTGSLMIMLAAAATMAAGLGASGGYEHFREEHGSISDILARAAGFEIGEIALAGNKELSDPEILAIAEIGRAHV